MFYFYIDILLDSSIHADIFWMPWAGDYVEYSDLEIVDSREIAIMNERGVEITVNKKIHPKMKDLLDRLSLIICGSAVYRFIKTSFPTTTLKHMNHYFHQDVIEIEDGHIDLSERHKLEAFESAIDHSLTKIIIGNSGSLSNNYLMAIEFLAQSPLADQLHITVMNSYGQAQNYDMLITCQARSAAGKMILAQACADKDSWSNGLSAIKRC